MRNMRRLVQVAAWLLFVYLILKTTFPMELALPVNLLLRLDPLAAVSTWLASRKIEGLFLISLLTVGATLILGRFFCGWICPLGTTMDAFEKTLPSGNDPMKSPAWGAIRFVLLAGILFAALAGISIVHFFDPLVIITRGFILGIFPPAVSLLDFLSGRLPLLENIRLTPVVHPSFRQSWFFLLILLGIISLSLIRRRFWCRYLCPLGALLDLLSRAAIWRRTISDRCNACGLCRKGCRMGGESCIHCYTCQSLCPRKAVRFKFSLPEKRSVSKTGFSRNRRILLAGLGTGALLAALQKLNIGRAVSVSRIIRPPNALPEDDFQASCLRCGECMKACVTNGLEPVILEGGLSRIWTPRLIPRKGHCEQRCNFCGRVCPSGAIRPFSVEEKPRLVMGLARVERKACAAWSHGAKCYICGEFCSYSAIRPEMHRGVPCPVVDASRCTGCGLCEFGCPVQPDGAIRVYAKGL
jgi:polyferredoxin